jgi:hypothetical protein
MKLDFFLSKANGQIMGVLSPAGAIICRLNGEIKFLIYNDVLECA